MVVARFLGNVQRAGVVRATGFRKHVRGTIVTVFANPTQIAFAGSVLVARAVSITVGCRRTRGLAVSTVPITKTPVNSAVPIFVTHTLPAGLAGTVSSTRGRILAVAGVPFPIVDTRTLARGVTGAPAAAYAFARTEVLAVLPPSSIGTGTVRIGTNVGHHTCSYPTALVDTRVLAGGAGISNLAVAIDHQSRRLALPMPTAKGPVVFWTCQFTAAHFISGFVIKVTCIAFTCPGVVAGALFGTVATDSSVLFRHHTSQPLRRTSRVSCVLSQISKTRVLAMGTVIPFFTRTTAVGVLKVGVAYLTVIPRPLPFAVARPQRIQPIHGV